jgi:hypothetical protein
MEVHTDLHRARLASGLSLEDLQNRTALSVGVLKKIDEGRFDELPAGLYARAYLKKFAAEVGVEPEAALAHLEPVLPAAPDPLPVLKDIEAEPAGTLHAQLARISAATFDALVLILSVVAPVLLLAAWSIGVELGTLLALAGGPLAAFCALPVALYFVVFDGIGGATPGHRMFRRSEVSNAQTPLRLPDILKRAVSP